MSHEVDKIRVYHCGLCPGFGGEIPTQLSWEPALPVYSQGVLAGLQSLAVS